MTLVANLLILWVIVSFPLGLFVGLCMAVGMSDE